MSDTYLPPKPFKGIESFQYADRNIFSEREEEKRLLFDLIQIFKGSLLYGQSGMGKSSLIQAGLIPMVEKYYQPEIIKIRPSKNQTFIVYKIMKEAENNVYFESLFDSFGVKDGKITLSFEEFETTIIAKSSDKLATPALLIFDQFEELITYFEEAGTGAADDDLDKKERLDFQQKIIKLLQRLYYDTNLKLKLLFVFREDYLAKFSKLFELVTDLNDQYLRLLPVPTQNIPNIIKKPFNFENNQKYASPFNTDFINNLTQKLKQHFGEEDVSLTDIQIACLFLYKKNELERTAYISNANAIKSIIEAFYKNELEALGEKKKVAISILTMLVLNEKTRNILPSEAIAKELTSYEPTNIENVLQKLEERRLIRKETRKDGPYYEISSEAMIPWINSEKIKKETENTLIKIKKKRALRIFYVASLTFAAMIYIFNLLQSKDLKIKSNEIVNNVMLSTANKYLQDGNIKDAFEIFGILDSMGSAAIKNRIRNMKFDYSDIPGKAIYPVKNNFLFSYIKDSTYEIWQVTSPQKTRHINTFSSLALRAYNEKYLAMYNSKKQLILYDFIEEKQWPIAQLTSEDPDFAFSDYGEYFVYGTGTDLFVVSLKNQMKQTHFKIFEAYKDIFHDIYKVSENYVYTNYDKKNIAGWRKDEKDSLIYDDLFGPYEKLYTLNEDSLLILDYSKISIFYTGTRKEKSIYTINTALYQNSKKLTDSLALLYTTNAAAYYTSMAYFDVKKRKLYPIFNKGLYHKYSVNVDRTKCLLSNDKGVVYIIEKRDEKFEIRPLFNDKNPSAYDISDDGNYILYVIKKQDEKELKNSIGIRDTAEIFLYSVKNEISKKIDEISESLNTDDKDDGTSIYGNYYFRFNSTSDKFAYLKKQYDSTKNKFIVRNVDDTAIVYSSSNIKTMAEGKEDFTKYYAHIFTKDGKEGIILLNGEPRTPKYYFKRYPKLNKTEWDKKKESLNLGL